MLLGIVALAGCSQAPTEATAPSAPHRERPFESPVLFHGDSWNYTFTRTGTFPYMCHPHTWMRGTVEVVARGQPAMHNVTVDIYQNPDGTMGYEPANITVQVGDKVQWINHSKPAHSLMDETEMTGMNHEP